MCQYNNIYKRTKKYKQKAEKKKKKTVAAIATVPLGIVATVQNLKKKKKDKVTQQNGTIDVPCKNTRCTVQKYNTCIRAFIYRILLLWAHNSKPILEKVHRKLKKF